MANNLLIQNKKARFQYEFIEKFVAGIELYGTEIKSIREGKASLVDAYCRFSTHIQRPSRPELFILMNISEYSHGGYSNHEPRRERRLLLHRRELSKLVKKIKTTGFTIVPITKLVGSPVDIFDAPVSIVTGFTCAGFTSSAGSICAIPLMSSIS